MFKCLKKKDISCKWNQKKTWVNILILDKIDFISKNCNKK